MKQLLFFISAFVFSGALAQTKPQIEWIDIPAGSFVMGSLESEPERRSDETSHKVSVKAFKMSKYEITFEQYDAFCEATGRAKPDDGGWGRGKQPAINIQWDDAKAFAEWMGCRLPTEAEWEYACRAGSAQLFSMGNTLTTAQANFNGNFPSQGSEKGEYRKKPVPVGSFSPNAFGLFDMHGNVSEWCADWYAPYIAEETNNPKGPAAGKHRVYRGGGWSSWGKVLRCASRFFDPMRFDSIGFRLVKN